MINQESKKLGFTLIELLVVISIIGLLSSIILVSLASARLKARDAKRISDLKTISTALELYYSDYGYYPQADCGWDQNCYRYSYDSASWGALATDLAPYISKLPVDPINSACSPWIPFCYSYTYGNVGRVTKRVQYDLTGQLEDLNSSYRCTIQNYVFYFDSRQWCNGGGYSQQIFEASPN